MGRTLSSGFVLGDNDASVSKFVNALQPGEGSDEPLNVARLNCIWHTLVKDLPKSKKTFGHKAETKDF